MCFVIFPDFYRLKIRPIIGIFRKFLDFSLTGKTKHFFADNCRKSNTVHWTVSHWLYQNGKWMYHLDAFNLSSNLQQTPYWFDEALIMVIAHSFDFLVMTLYSDIQSIHKFVRTCAIVNSSEKWCPLLQIWTSCNSFHYYFVIMLSKHFAVRVLNEVSPGECQFRPYAKYHAVLL